VFKRGFSIFFFIGLVIFAARAQIQTGRPLVRNVKIFGIAHLKQEDVLSAVNLRQGNVLPAEWPDKVLEHLLFLYHRRGYFQARIDSVWSRFFADSQFVNIHLWIFEGEPVTVGRLEIVGTEGTFKQKLLGVLESRPGSIFNEQAFQRDVEGMLQFLEKRGYPLSKIEIETLSLRMEEGKPKMDIVLRVEQGSLVTIGSVKVKGNRLTGEKVILREARIESGNLYRHDKVLSIRERLQRLGYFQKVEEPEILFIKDKAFITLNVQEGNTNTLDGVLGYNPPKRERGKGYFTGRLQFTFQNLFGTGRFLEAYWEKKDDCSQAMRFGYEEPWIFGWPLHIGGRFRQDIRDTTYVEREWKFSARYTPWASLSLHVEGGQKEVLPDSLGSVLYKLVQSKSWLLSLGFDYNTLDDPVNPRSGVRYMTTLTAGRKRNLGSDFPLEQNKGKRLFNTRLVQVDAEVALTTFTNQVFYLGLHGSEIKTGELCVPLSDQIRFGGARTLRGYAEDAFRGSLVAWVNGEYRYLIGPHSRAFLFVDGGMYQRREKELGFVRGVKMGYGFGIRMETRLGVMGMDYGLGEGDSLMRGKIHVGLVNRF